MDSNGYKNNNNEIILLICKKQNDSIIFNMRLNGGFNDIILWQDKFIDKINYNNYTIVLLNDFPNDIINLKKNRNIQIEDIYNEFFKKEYEQFKTDSII